jgi:hypothetical protein
VNQPVRVAFKVLLVAAALLPIILMLPLTGGRP